MSPSLMIVDDSRAIVRALEKHFSESGYDVSTAPDGETALKLFPQKMPDVVILDIKMPGMDGIEVLEKIKEMDPDAAVIMVTALEDMQTTIKAVQRGAYEYINKPIDIDKLEVTIRRALENRQLKERITHIASDSREEFRINNIIGKNPKIKEIFKIIGSVTNNRATVLITGESGTGKELVAKAIHFNSPFAASPFVAVNCTALTETLLESELFGHVKGAFTGAISDKKGKFEVAGDGTIFLDEVGEMSQSLQVKLLRVLQEKEFERVGGNTKIKCDARVIAATNTALEDKVAKGEFREDLYYRLKVVEINLPPLRERKEDIPLLVEYLLEKIARELHRKPKAVPPETMNVFLNYNWPGNIRELENMLMRAMVLAKGDILTPDLFHLGSAPTPSKVVPAAQEKAPQPPSLPQPTQLKSLVEVEREHIKLVLDTLNWNKKRACEVLGVSRPTLDKKIRDYNLEQKES